MLIDNEYVEINDTKILLSIKKKSDDYFYYWHERNLMHFHQKNFNEWHTGLFNFEFNPITDDHEKIISLVVKTGNLEEELKNVRVKFLSKNSANNK